MALSSVSNLRVLYEDNHIIAINKRASDIVQGDKTRDEALSDIVKAWLKLKYSKPGNVFVGVVHRIDRPVSGIILFAKTSKALTRLNAQFKAREVSKTYLAAVGKMPEQLSGELTHYLKKDASRNKSFLVSLGHKLGKKAILTYRVLSKGDRYFLLEIKPQSGRHHQIRVQLAAMGCPIKGDLKYGAARSNKDASIHLHAWKLNLTHPVSKMPLSLCAPVPDDTLWQSLVGLASISQ